MNGNVINLSVKTVNVPEPGDVAWAAMLERGEAEKSGRKAGENPGRHGAGLGLGERGAASPRDGRGGWVRRVRWACRAQKVVRMPRSKPVELPLALLLAVPGGTSEPPLKEPAVIEAPPWLPTRAQVV